jgi:hypothetical protein
MRATGAERRPHGQLESSGVGSRELEVRHIEARDQQDEKPSQQE